ncbi:MAG: peptide-methionine (S)-S-oxide reductase [Spirochaetaceae bacterium]|nr:MAG: peptide-methionine (S)-S-oxide reductase [Spirochaetaceae bacterium]
MAESSKIQTATLGGGCFWCIEAVFRRIDGVESVQSGYCGGSVANPSYEDVCTGQTGHAEVVQVNYDPSIVSYDRILETFFKAHDPTTVDRQGADVGSQYRSIIFYHSDEQKLIAERMVDTVQKLLGKPVVTRIEPSAEFYAAEAYHDRYFDRNPGAGYCRVVIQPKLQKLGML